MAQAPQKKLLDRIAPEAHSLGLFRPALKSRKRLQLLTVLVLCAQCLLLWGGGTAIEKYSHSPGLNIFAIAFLCATLLVSGYFVALVVGDLIFPGPWREKMFRGEKFVPEKFADQTALLKNRGIYFILLWVLCTVGVSFGADFVTGGFLERYRKSGSILTMMKSEQEQDRLSALEIYVNPLSSRRWDVQDLRAQTVRMLQDESERVRAQASYVLGRLSVGDAAEALTSMLQDKDAQVRMQAAIALGRMQWLPARTQLLAALQSAFEGKRFVEASDIVYGLTLLNDKAVIGPVQRLLEQCDEVGTCEPLFVAYAFYLLKTLQAPGAAKLSVRFLENSKTTKEIRCFAADCLRYTAKPRDIDTLKHLFAQAGVQEECAPLYKKLNEEAAVLLFDAEPVRAKLLRAVGNQRDMRNYDWIWTIGADTSEHPQTRKAAEIYTRAMLGQE